MMRGMTMTPLAEGRDWHHLNDQSSRSSSSYGSFDSSFGSSASSYEQCYTPSRRESSVNIDMDRLPSSRTSSTSTGPNSLANDSMLYPWTSFPGDIKIEGHDTNLLFATPCNKGIPSYSMMGYGYQQVDTVYNPPHLQSPFDCLPDLMFEDSSAMVFNDSSSPVQLSSSPENFVVPSQTFISEPFRPKTPQNSSRIELGSPLATYSQHSGSMRYFMSPRDTDSHTPDSVLSSVPDLTPQTTPFRQPLGYQAQLHQFESSAALQRVQSIVGTRVRKQQRKIQDVTAKIERIAPGLFFCDFPGCKSEHGFKRNEHLKRHKKTHGAQKILQCKYCAKKFQLDRFDNYRSHVYLHSQNKKGSRTKYFPEAQLEVDSWKKGREAEKIGVDGEIYRVYTRKGRVSQRTAANPSS